MWNLEVRWSGARGPPLPQGSRPASFLVLDLPQTCLTSWAGSRGPGISRLCSCYGQRHHEAPSLCTQGRGGGLGAVPRPGPGMHALWAALALLPARDEGSSSLGKDAGCLRGAPVRPPPPDPLLPRSTPGASDGGGTSSLGLGYCPLALDHTRSLPTGEAKVSWALGAGGGPCSGVAS